MTVPKLWSDHDTRVKPYVWSHRWVGMARSAVGLAFMAVLVFGLRGKHLEWMLNAFTRRPFVLWLWYFGALGLFWEVISFPFSWLSYRIERKHGLSKQAFGPWLWDKVKGLLVGAVLGAVALGIVYASVAGFGPTWWAWCATFFLLFSIVLAQLAPVLLIPLFFKMKPMEAGPLKERLLSLCAKFGVEVKDVYHLGLGEKTEKGNAAFVGLGKTKRILIGDTLYEKYPVEQVEAVFAHELGHQVHNDLWKGIAFSAIFTYIAFGIANDLALHWALPGLDAQLDRPFGMLVFFVLLSVVQIPIGILQAMFSRQRERMADAFASDTTGLAAPLADALEQLTLQNWSFFQPNAFLEFLTYSHPAPWRRITKLRGK